MGIRKKYVMRNRIALALSVLFGVLIFLQFKNIGEAIALFVIAMTIIILVLDAKKNKDIDRVFGVLKVSDNKWLGMDGLWHDGYSEIIRVKVEKYYENGGEDFGHTFGRIEMYLFIMTCFGILYILTNQWLYLQGLAPKIFLVVFSVGFWLYIIIKKNVLG